MEDIAFPQPLYPRSLHSPVHLLNTRLSLLIFEHLSDDQDIVRFGATCVQFYRIVRKYFQWKKSGELPHQGSPRISPRKVRLDGNKINGADS